jgi:hypothetical protein
LLQHIEIVIRLWDSFDTDLEHLKISNDNHPPDSQGLLAPPVAIWNIICLLFDLLSPLPSLFDPKITSRRRRAATDEMETVVSRSRFILK